MAGPTSIKASVGHSDLRQQGFDVIFPERLGTLRRQLCFLLTYRAVAVFRRAGK
jgi:hypothetical protein